MTDKKTIHVILNDSSGLDANDETPGLLKRIFAESGFDATIKRIEKGTDVRELALAMMRDGAELVVAGGGDGTVNAVASALIGTSVTLGVLPCGTLNHFARDLKMPFDLADAARVISEGRIIRADVGQVNGRHFINNAIIGLYPSYRFERDRRERRGRQRWFAVGSALLDVFRRNPALSVRVDADGEGVVRKTPFLMVANNRHEMEGYRLGNRGSLSEGRLWLYVMHRMSRLGLIRLGVSIMLGRFSKGRDFDLVSAREITVESRRKTIGVSLDGEVVRMQPPLLYKSLPGVLKVIVPRTEVPHP